MPKNTKSTKLTLQAIVDNNLDEFKANLANAYIFDYVSGATVIDFVIRLGRSEMLRLIAEHLEDKGIFPFIDLPVHLNKKDYHYNRLQYAFYMCDLKSVQALVTAYNNLKKPSDKSIREILLNPKFYDATGKSILGALFNTIDRPILADSFKFDGDKYSSSEEIQAAGHFICDWLQFGSQEKRSDEAKSDSSSPSTDAETSSLEGERIVDIVWVGPIQKIKYMCALLDLSHYDGADVSLNETIDDCKKKLAENDSLVYWQTVVKENTSFINCELLSFDVDPEAKKPVMLIKMTQKGVSPIKLRIAFNVDEACQFVLDQYERSQNKDYARKSSVEDLKTKFGNTPDGMHQAVLASLKDYPALESFYQDVCSTVITELQRLKINGKQYFIDKNYQYQIAIVAVTLIGETQGMIGNAVASGVKQAGNFLVSYHSSKQDRAAVATFKLAAKETTHPEQLIGVCVANALVKSLGKQILENPGSVNIAKVKPALVRALQGLHKAKLPADSSAFDHIAAEIEKAMNRKSGPSCAIM